MVRRKRLSQVGLVIAGGVLATIVAGCGGEAGQTSETLGPGTTSASTTSSASGTTSQPDNASTTESARADCKAKDLELSFGRGDAAAGTVYRPLIFKNIGKTTCVVHGFPGVSYVAGADAQQVGPAAFREGNKGDAITLREGELASAVVGFVNGQNFDPAECQPQPVRGVRVYPPQETESIIVELPGTGCASDKIPGNQLTVRTAVAGAGG